MDAPKHQEVEEKGKFERLIDTLYEFIELKLKYYKLLAYEKSSKMVVFLLAAFVLIGFALVCFLLINIAIGFVLADIFDSLAIGFAIIAGFNLFIALAVFIFRKQLLLNPMINFTIGMIMKNEHENE